MWPRRLLLASLLALVPALLPAQETPTTCEIIRTETATGAGDIVTIVGPFEVQCEGGVVLRAQNGTLNQLTRELQLFGSVFFEDPRQTLTSDQATYSSALGRLYATGNVVFTNREQGSTLRGPELEYFRVQPGREQALVNAGQRPHLTLIPKQQQARAQQRPGGSKPLDIDADRVSIVGEDDLSAFGDVVIRQDSVTSTAAEARYNGQTENMELRGGARVQNPDYELVGELITARTSDGALERVRAVTNARMAGERLTVTAPELQLFFTRDTLQRTVASGGGKEGAARALALSKGFRLEADSIDALLPEQQLREVIAIGRARGEVLDTTRADTTAPPPAVRPDSAARAAAPADSSAPPPSSTLALIGSDWIAGDTVIGYFAPRDTAAGARADTTAELQRLVAKGSAQSLYRVEQDRKREGAGAEPTPPAQPAPDGSGKRGINFLAGDVIELTMKNGEMDVATVTGLKRGLYLDPAPPPAPTPAAEPPSGDVGAAPTGAGGTAATPPQARRP